MSSLESGVDWNDAKSGTLTYKRRWHNTTEVLPTDFTWNGHPLVVIDPEDREQVIDLVARYCENYCENYGGKCEPEGRHRAGTSAMQAALRSLITPPRPEEPTGLGAVVEVLSTQPGLEGVKKRLVRGHATWDPWMGDNQKREWDEIPGPIIVLSEGIQ